MAAEKAKRFAGCKELFAALSEYLDEELPPGDCAEIELHLSDCRPCVEFVESLNRTVGLCREHGIHDRPGALSAEAVGKLRDAYVRAVSALRGSGG